MKSHQFQKTVLGELTIIKQEMTILKVEVSELKNFKWWILGGVGGGLGIAIVSLITLLAK